MWMSQHYAEPDRSTGKYRYVMFVTATFPIYFQTVFRLLKENLMNKKSIFGVLFGLALAFSVILTPAAAQAADDSCWGQATKVFAQMGEMGEHARSYENPRLGLRNLARMLYELPDSPLPNDSMAALGAFVAAELGLTIEACQ
jgi:hypothetical protein